MRAAIVENGKVSNIAILEDPALAAEQGWEIISDGADVSIGWTFDGGSFVAPIPPDKYPDLQSARVAMVGYIDALTKQITDDYPASEVASWGSKAEAARAVKAGTARADQTAMIQNEADITGRTLAAQAAAVIAKAALFEEVISKASGLRQVTDIALVAATTSAQREAILQAAMAQAQSLAEPFGL